MTSENTYVFFSYQLIVVIRSTRHRQRPVVTVGEVRMEACGGAPHICTAWGSAAPADSRHRRTGHRRRDVTRDAATKHPQSFTELRHNPRFESTGLAPPLVGQLTFTYDLLMYFSETNNIVLFNYTGIQYSVFYLSIFGVLLWEATDWL